jgi:tetratricopeptide (TPR) repeat protein
MAFANNKSAYESDVVELVSDLAKADFKRGQRGTVVAGFDEPSEAYDLEMEDSSGNFVGFAYSVKPNQFNNLSRNAFVRAMEAVENADLVVAETELKKATELRPDYIGGFVMSVLKTLPDTLEQRGLEDNVSYLIPLLRLAVRVDPEYEFARSNLAVAFLNFGVAKARKKKYQEAIELFYSALAIKTDPETESRIKINLVMAFTTLGRESFKNTRVEEGFAYVRTAFLIIQDETTRRNLGLAYGNLGLSYMKSQRFDFAIEQFQRAEDCGVVLPDFVNDYGICLVFLGRVGEALHTFERVLEIVPQNEEARFNLEKLKQFSTQQLTQSDLDALGKQFYVPKEDLSDFDGQMLKALAWRKPPVAAGDFVWAA